ncbi:MAG TPA: amino acid adenylation domain-containing protein, partial [Thermoanaerobaculia bacterium]|nr:amino acid adenylation domain-containing protein [Thermoanaerobaculia bacterium]
MTSSHVEEEAAAQGAEAGDVVTAGCSSFVELLRARAAAELPGSGYRFLADGEVEEESLSFAELDRRARAVAATLQRLAGTGERALLLYPPGLQFLVAFFGCLYAGIVAVPAYPPRPRRSPDRLRVLLADASPALVLTTGALARHGAAWAADLPALAAARWVVTDGPWSTLPAASAPEVVDVPPEAAADWRPPELGPGTVAFLQYTSGSTSAPKGVVVSHGNLLHNQLQMESAFRAGASSVVVSWLPPYHDMGLIGALLQPLYAGASCVLMSPAAFLLKPLRWLQAISRYRATISGGPDFAYALCVERSSPEQRRELDLSCWEVAFNGAEPVRAATLDRFTAAFAPHGFRREAFQPCYGLAEATLLVAGGGGAPRVLTLAAGPLARHRVVPLEPGQPDARQLVGCGHTQGGQRLTIVDPETLAPSAGGVVGEIWVGGRSVALGYWGRSEESRETFGACIAGSGEGPFLRTGDLGFLADGELFVTGRIKDLVILRGRNHYPQDIEVTAARSHPALRPGCCAAFAVDGTAGEELVVVQEIARHRETDAAAAAEAIRAEIVAEHDVAPADVVLVPAGTIPKTSSGKIQRAACRRRYLAGTLEVVLQSPMAAAVPDAAVDAMAAVLPASRELRQEVARVLRLPASELPSDQPLSRLGLDSLTAFELAARIEERWGHRLSMPSLLGDCSLDDLAGEVAEQGSGAPPAPPRPSLALEESAGVAAAPLSHGQRALWYLRQLAPASTAYHLAAAARIAGDLDRPALRQAFQALLDRHPALRSTFTAQGGDDPLQQAPAGAEIAFEEWPADDWSEPELVRRLADEAARPFDLERGPLLRVGLADRGGGAPVLLVACHHIAADFWSLAVLAEELGKLYEVCRAGLPLAAAGLGPLPPPPAVLAERQERRLQGGEGERLWAFWSRQLAGAPQELELPADRPRPRVQGWRGARVRSALTPELTAGLGALGRSLGATPFAALLGGFLALLHRVSGQDDLLVGVPTSGRDAADLPRAVGYHVNPIVVRSTAPAGSSFTDRLAVLRQTLLAAFAHQDFPFALLAERLQPVRDPGRAPLFQAMIVHHQTPAFAPAGLAELALGEAGARLELGALTLEGVPLPERSSQLDLALFAATVNGRLALHLQYDSDLFDAVSARRLLAHLEALLAAAVADPARPAESLPILAESELHQLVREWNSASFEHDREPCLHDLVAAQAARTPEATALVCAMCAGERLSYRDLVDSAERLAGHLRSLGAGPEVRVAVLAERSPELVIGLLAVLSAGAAYVPLDPGYPAARLAFALDDSRPRLLLTHRRLLGRLPSAAGPPDFDVVELDGRWWESATPAAAGPAAPPAATVAPGNLAYLIYTSGSTGRPKAVAVEHRNAVALCAWAASAFSAAELAGVLAATSIGFDLSVFELFAPLACGGAVILVDDVLALTRPDGVPAQPPVTLVNTVPSSMAELLRAGAVPASVLAVALAGEPLHGSLLRAIHDGCGARRVLNLYGPSEDTTYSTSAELARGEERPPIGRPLANRVALVLDVHLHPVPIGVPGELFLSGAGLARGYFGRPEATAERFLPDGVTGRAGERLYRTGDRARLLPDGRLDFLGRRDHQVKLRGFRLELGEVDAVLAAHPGVRAAVTLLRDDGGER